MVHELPSLKVAGLGIAGGLGSEAFGPEYAGSGLYFSLSPQPVVVATIVLRPRTAKVGRVKAAIARRMRAGSWWRLRRARNPTRSRITRRSATASWTDDLRRENRGTRSGPADCPCIPPVLSRPSAPPKPPPTKTREKNREV